MHLVPRAVIVPRMKEIQFFEAEGTIGFCSEEEGSRLAVAREVANLEKKLSSFIPIEDAPCITDVE